MNQWHFSIDVGGTFTDAVGYAPDGSLHTCKTLSTGLERGGRRIEAPIVAIRQILHLQDDDEIPPVSVRLGTTRGTNALLTRRGAPTALVTTEGFADLLRIGTQARPNLFDLSIVRPDPLFSRVIEIPERTDAGGRVDRAPDAEVVERLLRDAAEDGIESIAIMLLHSWRNPANEIVVEKIASSLGFANVTRSSRLSPVIRAVPRGNTALLDAYLNPVLNDYIASIRSSLGPDSRLQVMTSSGGLVAGENFSGRESILSGPAGGVIGYAHISEESGIDQAIGFDMGGTSTDVSRYGGRLEREAETEKGGVPVFAPTLAIETVAAGGGSICGFDGVRLTVGPTSAGADPGPACYGSGGPLTVTDMNLLLGRIIPERFPFTPDHARVNELVDQRIEEIAGSPMGRIYTREELAEGYISIANHRMVRAIRKISVARGFDPSEHVLITFGGAGGQHACAIARELGIGKVLVHPQAGILSAWGIGLADIRKVREESVLLPYDDVVGEGLEEIFGRLEREAISDVLGEGIERAEVEEPVRSLELRYQGFETTIEVLCPEDHTWSAAYEVAHRRLYGYTNSERSVEVTTARVEVVGRTRKHGYGAADVPSGPAVPPATTNLWFGGESVSAPLYRREEMAPGAVVQGPAVISEPFSTHIVEPDFCATVNDRRELILQPKEGSGESSGRPTTGSEAVSESDVSDPVLLEIFNNRFASIAEQMGERLRQTATSTNVKERLDYSCALFSPRGDLVVNAPHIPVHLGAMAETVRGIIEDNPGMKPGDVYATNDPFRGGSHLPDVTIVTPVHDHSSGKLLFLVASRAHHAEIGGITPGSMPPFSHNLAEEGVVIRNLKIVAEGASREEVLAEVLRSGPWPSRDVPGNLADVRAQVAANRRGVELLLELVDRYGVRVVQDYMEHLRRSAAEKMRLVLVALDDGVYRFTDHLDDGTPITVAITIDGDRASVDFTGSGAVLPTNLNANRAIVTAAVLYVFRCMIREEIPLNGGVLEPVEIIIPESLLNPPSDRDPSRSPAVVGGNVETSQRVVDVLLGALGLAAASQGTMNNLTFGDDGFGYYETICGGSGATPDAPGADAVHTHMTNTRLTDVEVLEQRYPVRVRRFSIRRGSGGKGEHRGGDGVIREIEFLHPLSLSILSERRGPYLPWGLCGGESGAEGVNRLYRADGTAEELGGKCVVDVDEGDRIEIRTPGGGGYGRSDRDDHPMRSGNI